MLAGLDFVGVFFVKVPHVAYLWVAEDGVVVKTELGIQGQEVFFFGDDEWVDFEHGAVAGQEGGVETFQQFDGLGGEFAGEAKGKGDLSALEGGEADQRVDGFGDDFFRSFGGHFFDVHAPFG